MDDNISNNITKQLYGIIKTFKVLVIAKKKQFSRTKILIYDRFVTLNKQAFFDFKNIFMIPYAKMVNLSKDEILLQFRRSSRIALPFDSLTFLNNKGDIFFRPNFQVSIRLTVIGRTAPSTLTFINYS